MFGNKEEMRAYAVCNTHYPFICAVRAAKEYYSSVQYARHKPGATGKVKILLFRKTRLNLFKQQISKLNIKIQKLSIKYFNLVFNLNAIF